MLEYEVPPKKCPELKNLTNHWIALNSLVPGTGPYNAVLQSLTNEVTPTNANPLALNCSAMGQVRTNQVTLGLPWELTEHTLQGITPTPLLAHTTVKNTPDPSLNNTAVINPVAGSIPVPGQALIGTTLTDVLAASNRHGPLSMPLNLSRRLHPWQ